MKRKILIANMLVAASSVVFAQTPVKEVVLPATSTTLNVTLQNSVNSTYNWSEVGASGNIQTDLSTLNTGNVTINLVPTVSNGDEATIRVTATSVVGSCVSNSLDRIIRVVNTPTYSVTSISTSAAICQGETPAAIDIAFNNIVDRFTYYIDVDNSGTMNGTESLVSVNVGAASTSFSVGVLNTVGSYNVRINTIVAGLISSPSTSTSALVVNERPVIQSVD